MIVRPNIDGDWFVINLPWNPPRLFDELLPGEHVVLLADKPTDGLAGRRFGLELRDTLFVVAPKGVSFAFIFRKEIEGTVAENVLKHGTGALNIDACRVMTTESLNGGAYTGDLREKTTEWQNADRSNGKGSGFRQGLGEYQQPSGRWPSNLVLVHGPGCRRDGTKTIRGTGGGWNGLGGDDARQVYGKGWNPDGVSRQGDGIEIVATWECSCLVLNLDEQSGERPSQGRRVSASSLFSGLNAQPDADTGYGDQGGASRFFPQFGSEAAFLAWLRVLISMP